MVKVFGPAMSLDASGTLADTITFSKWKGRNYVRERVIPSNPRSGGQVGRRGMFKFISQAWAALATPEKASWQTKADELVASPFNGYVSVSMKNWHNFLAPSKLAIATRDDTDPVITAGTTAAWEENRIKISGAITTINDGWNLMFHAFLASGFSTSVGNLIFAEFNESAATFEYFWTPPSVATWYFNLRSGTADGKLGSEDGEFSAVPP